MHVDTFNTGCMSQSAPGRVGNSTRGSCFVTSSVGARDAVEGFPWPRGSALAFLILKVWSSCLEDTERVEQRGSRPGNCCRQASS